MAAGEISGDIFVSIVFNERDPQKRIDIGRDGFKSFSWKAFLNGGYIMRAIIADPYLDALKEFVFTTGYLNNARRRPDAFSVRFRFGFTPAQSIGDDVINTREAILTDIDILGTGQDGSWEIVAIDPPSFCLNSGNGNGKVYIGRVSEVIRQVYREYMILEDDPSLFEIDVTETLDDPNNRWPMMRQDPQTFIRSLLDWSSSITPKKTNWVIASLDRKLVVKEHADLASGGGRLIGTYNANWRGSPASDVRSFDYVGDNIMTGLNTRLITQGISAVTGKFLDQFTPFRNDLRVFGPRGDFGFFVPSGTLSGPCVVDDFSTANKVNVLRLSRQRGFAKPDPGLQWGDAIMSIPEHNGGETGILYEDYIDGRARYHHLNLLPLVMRVRVTVAGDVRYDDPTRLGVDCVRLNWADIESDEGFFLSGNWIIYGFHHYMTRAHFDTDLYLYRIDRDAVAQTRINCLEPGP